MFNQNSDASLIIENSLIIESRLNFETDRARAVTSELTPTIAFSSVIVTCLALSTAVTTCCWC